MNSQSNSIPRLIHEVPLYAVAGGVAYAKCEYEQIHALFRMFLVTE
jgi:hypothetical protein